MSDYLLVLKDREKVAKDTMAFRFDTVGAGYTFRPGQNADFSLVNPPETDDQGNVRTLSFATSPNDRASFTVAMRMRNTAFKNSLQAIPIGARVKVSRPMGSFTLHKDSSKPAVFLAGGIGITPMLSMIGWATEEKLPHKMYLFYSNRTPQEAPFMDRLEEWARQNPNFKLIATVTRDYNFSWLYELGRINRDMLTKHLAEIQTPIYYLAGPPGMVTAMLLLLDSIGVSEDNIKTEEFAGY
ncbi:MAG TPA: FAD-dependent oxidoreductase [Terriglobia bacterium]|nr:FAD-dependent oxidoreductase [Terriglobia bacterium]